MNDLNNFHSINLSLFFDSVKFDQDQAQDTIFGNRLL